MHIDVDGLSSEAVEKFRSCMTGSRGAYVTWTKSGMHYVSYGNVMQATWTGRGCDIPINLACGALRPKVGRTVRIRKKIEAMYCETRPGKP